MKKIRFVVCLWIVIGILLVVSFNKYTNESYGEKVDLKLSKVDIDDDKINNIKQILLTSDYLRDGYVETNNLSDEVMLKQILLSVSEEEYKVINVKPTKVMCLVKSNLWFISTNTCKVRIIEDDIIKKYEKKLFNKDKDIQIEEIEFKGLHCKYNNKYYCNVTEYKEENKSYSYVDKIYKDNNNLYVYEYYLHIDYSLDDICRKYYNNEFCDDKSKDIPNIDDSIIKSDGVYYKHTFKLNEDKEYYLYSSEVVT